jgi:hypothetical protein
MNFSFLKDNGPKDDESESFTSKFSMSMGGGGKNNRRSSVDSEEIKKRQHAQRVESVMGLMDDFRLQCPQTHTGLVVAYTKKTLSPLIDPDVKFKWYRLEGEKDEFILIDESVRAW